MAFVVSLLRSDLRNRWRSSALLAALVAVVVTAVLTAAGGARRTVTAFDRYLAGVGPIDATLLVEGDGADAAKVGAVEGVRAAIGFRWFLVVPVVDRVGFYPMFVPDDLRMPGEYLRFPVVRGRTANPDEPLEVALGERTARRLGVDVGDALPMVSYTPADVAAGTIENPQGPEIALQVVGIVRDQGDIAGRENDLDFTFLTPAFASRYEDHIAIFAKGIVLDLDPRVSVDAVLADIEPLGQFEFDRGFSQATYRAQLDPTLRSMATALRIAALVLAFTGLVAIVQAMTRAATERARDHFALRALGGTRATVLSQLVVPAGLASAVGVIVGTVGSVIASPLLPWGLARRVEPDPGIRSDSAVLIWGLIGSSAILAVAIASVALIVVRRERRPAAGSRGSAIAAMAARLGAPVVVVTGLRLALEPGRGARATPVRTAVGAAALGVTGVLATVVFGASMHHAVTTPAVYGWGWDAALSGAQGDQISDGMVNEADLIADQSFSAVAEVTHDIEVTVNGEPERATAIQDRRGHTSFVIVRGAEPIGPDEVAVGGRTLRELGLDLGDAIDVSAGGPARALRIVGVAALSVGVDGGSSSAGLAMSRRAADAIGFSGSCDGDVACSRNYVVKAAPGVDVAAALAAYAPEGVVEVSRPSPPSEIARLTAVEDVPRLLAALLGFIAILSVGHAAWATVRVRGRDFAVLRVLGFSTGELRSVVTIQVTVLALLGAAIGTAAGVLLGRIVWSAVADRVYFPVAITFPRASLMIVPFAIVILSNLGATLARRAAARVQGSALRGE